MTTFQDEQAGFERALPGLLADHFAQWVVHKGGTVAYFPSFEGAFNEGVRRFGIDTPVRDRQG